MGGGYIRRSFKNVKMQTKSRDGEGGGCVQRIEVILKMSKKKSGYGRVWGGGGSG